MPTVPIFDPEKAGALCRECASFAVIQTRSFKVWNTRSVADINIHNNHKYQFMLELLIELGSDKGAAFGLELLISVFIVAWA